MTSFVSAIAEEWSERAAPLAELGFRCATRQDVQLGKAVIEIEGPDRMALIEVWEHAQCLDTTIQHTAANHGAILAAGPCQSHSEALARLSALQAALLAPAMGAVPPKR